MPSPLRFDSASSHRVVRNATRVSSSRKVGSHLEVSDGPPCAHAPAGFRACSLLVAPALGRSATMPDGEHDDRRVVVVNFEDEPIAPSTKKRSAWFAACAGDDREEARVIAGELQSPSHGIVKASPGADALVLEVGDCLQQLVGGSSRPADPHACSGEALEYRADDFVVVDERLAPGALATESDLLTKLSEVGQGVQVGLQIRGHTGKLFIRQGLDSLDQLGSCHVEGPRCGKDKVELWCNATSVSSSRKVGSHLEDLDGPPCAQARRALACQRPSKRRACPGTGVSRHFGSTPHEASG